MNSRERRRKQKAETSKEAFPASSDGFLVSWMVLLVFLSGGVLEVFWFSNCFGCAFTY